MEPLSILWKMAHNDTRVPDDHVMVHNDMKVPDDHVIARMHSKLFV